MGRKKIRHLALVFGDQLDADSVLWDEFDPERDAVWMAEVDEESTHVWTHKARIALFLSAMRHFRESLEKRGYRVLYSQLDLQSTASTLMEDLAAAVEKHRPERILAVEPGEWRVKNELIKFCESEQLPLDLLPDRHFLSSVDEFKQHAKGRKQLRMEFFYREMRKKHDVLMDGNQPEGGKWNYDAANRKSFGKTGPPKVKSPKRFKPDKITREVLELVEARFSSHPGSLEHFDWPVTPKQAQAALEDFIANRLVDFGNYQDAMWTDEPWLFHSRISTALNLKLLNPRLVLRKAEQAYREGNAPLNAVEGFIRQILGWREYVRGVYWMNMPGYLDGNTLNAQEPLPDFYWTGETDMNCLSQAIGQTLDYGYAHHIQRLMVTGLFALMLGVNPQAVHEWYLAVYVDAVEWVEAPNTIGMSQYADGGVMASKPYVATGKYIHRMSNYCHDCKFHPDRATGDDACPFTTLYWDFLQRHQSSLRANNRMSLQLKNLDRKSSQELKQIAKQAQQLRNSLA